jgi:hypothetical protein
MMKHFLLFLLISFSIISCKKGNDVTDVVNSDDTPVLPADGIPPATPVNSNSRLYVLNPADIYNVSSGNNYLIYQTGGGGYDIKNLNSDKYYTHFKLGSTSTSNLTSTMGFEQSKVVALSSTVKNYTEIRMPALTNVGSTLYDYGTATFPLPNNGTIYIPPYTYTPTLGGPVSFSIKASYINPLISDYALTMPALFTDFNNKRSFLDSYGCYLILAAADDNTWYNIDFKQNAGVKIRMPIPPELLSSAPDSIIAWNFNLGNNTGKWERNGYAHKNANAYEKVINKKGYWNFATPVDGVYLSLHMRTMTDTAALKNLKFKIKTGNAEVADGRTDSEGNALVFVPKNKALQLEIRNDHYNNSAVMPGTINSLGIFSNSQEKTILIPDRYDIAVVEGNVYDCNGLPFSNGYAIMTTTNVDYRPDNYFIPITGGKFKISEFINYAGGQYSMDIYNNSNNLLSQTRLLITIDDLPPITPTSPHFYSYQNIALFSCSNAGKLYSNLKRDGASYNFISDINESVPKVTCDYTNSSSHKITILNNGLQISFGGFFTPTASLLANPLIVNGINCAYDNSNYNNEVLISRMDPNPGGIVEGWYSIHYRDNANIYHTLKGNFRAKRIG